MKLNFKARTRGALFRWTDGRTLYLLFETESTSYTASASGSMGTGSNDCLLVCEAEITLVHTFSSHVWNGETRSHNYMLSFNQCKAHAKIALNGKLVYTFVDGDSSPDRVAWEQSSTLPADGPCSCEVITISRNTKDLRGGWEELVFPMKFLSSINVNTDEVGKPIA